MPRQQLMHRSSYSDETCACPWS